MRRGKENGTRREDARKRGRELREEERKREREE